MRVLIVDDEVQLRQSLAQCLRREGYAVDTACDGEAALFMADGGQYDAILLDLMLPKMDGWTVLRKLRSGGNAAPLLILSACDALEHRVKVLDAGADDYLIKPFEIPELLARLRALIRRASGNPSSVIEIGQIVLDMAVRVVSRSGVPVPLTATEYALVELLALHHGKLVTRSMIHDHLFDDQDDRLSNLIEVHVSNVRRKLGKEFISTRRGHGYIIEKRARDGPAPRYAGRDAEHSL